MEDIIISCPGTGKHFFSKKELAADFFTNSMANFIIIDPDDEYSSFVNGLGGTSIKISTSSDKYINLFDFDISLLKDEKIDVISDKCQLITSFIAINQNRALLPTEISFIDRCVRQTYLNSKFFKKFNKVDIPILSDFRNVMEKETDNVNEEMKQKLLNVLDIYVDGSAKCFNNHSNIETDNRLISYNISEMSGVMKTQAMLLVLDNVWNRLSANRDKGVSTWIYFDEIHVFLKDEYCSQFIRDLNKRVIRYGGALFKIT